MTSTHKRELQAHYDSYLITTLKQDLANALKNSRDRFYSSGKCYVVKYAIWLLKQLKSNK